jgi:glycosyltransferase involved in cell wall biosynthesis
LRKYDVDFIGEVDDVNGYIQSNQIMIVPLLSGSGLKIKVLEAMAMACPVVTTPVGAEGIPGKHGVHFMVADTPKVFGEAISMLVASPDMRKEMGINGRKLVKEKFDNFTLSEGITDFYMKLLV